MNQKLYNLSKYYVNRMFPGDPYGSPDAFYSCLKQEVKLG